jgi:hypothetical protein
MQKLAIIHFSPIELYPPVLNWLNFLSQQNGNVRADVYTLKDFGRADFRPATQNIKVIRPGSMTRAAGSWRKNFLFAYANYILFYCITLLRLIITRPDVILYYETLSCFPAFIYKKYFRRKVRLFIHYHEYTSQEEYAKGMILSRWGLALEKRLFPRAEWISHTNADRIRLFRKDNEGIVLPSVHELPNYPPRSWQESRATGRMPGEPLRIVYVGALSMETMYTREFANWVTAQSGAVIWDIYSDNITPDARAFLESVENKYIRFREGVNYFSLPDILSKYDIGVILYKGHILNYVYNAPNKIFEYLACGLDVWFPRVMKGAMPLVTTGTFPKVIPLDFEMLDTFDLLPAIDRKGIEFRPASYCYEDVLSPLLKKIE